MHRLKNKNNKNKKNKNKNNTPDDSIKENIYDEENKDFNPLELKNKEKTNDDMLKYDKKKDDETNYIDKINSDKKRNEIVNIKNMSVENKIITNNNINDMNIKDNVLKKNKITSNDIVYDNDDGETIDSRINYSNIIQNISGINDCDNKLLLNNDGTKWYPISQIKREINTNEQKNIHNLEFRLYDSENVPRYKKKIMSETYDQYISKLNSLDKQKSKWIYNIVDGKSEQDKIIFMDDKFILMPTYFWNEEDICKMHLLAIVKNTKLKSLRDLRSCDVFLLEHILLISKNIIKNKYNVEHNLLKIYVHYPPSAWLFHIHFEIMANIETTSSVEYSHEISQIIFNLKLCSEYYKLYDVNTLINNE